MFTFPEMDTKTIVLVLALLSAVVLGAMFGLPYYQEGMKNKDKNKVAAAESQTVFSKSLNMDNDGEDLGDPMAFTEKNPLKACQKACADMADCIGFTADKVEEQCVFKSTKGEDMENPNITGFWKK
jgi:hypothetical protein